MNCKKCVKLLSLYIDGALDSKGKNMIDTHLDACADCRRELETLKSTVTMCQNITPMTLPPDFCKNVLAQLDNAPTYAPSPLQRVQKYIPVAVCCVLLISLAGPVYSLYQKSRPENAEVLTHSTATISPQTAPTEAPNSPSATPQISPSATPGDPINTPQATAQADATPFAAPVQTVAPGQSALPGTTAPPAGATLQPTSPPIVTQTEPPVVSSNPAKEPTNTMVPTVTPTDAPPALTPSPTPPSMSPLIIRQAQVYFLNDLVPQTGMIVYTDGAYTIYELAPDEFSDLLTQMTEVSTLEFVDDPTAIASIEFSPHMYYIVIRH